MNIKKAIKKWQSVVPIISRSAQQSWDDQLRFVMILFLKIALASLYFRVRLVYFAQFGDSPTYTRGLWAAGGSIFRIASPGW
jgi:hypothetical protein